MRDICVLEYEQEHEHAALLPTGSSYFQRPVSLQRRMRGGAIRRHESCFPFVRSRRPVFGLKPASNLPPHGAKNKKQNNKSTEKEDEIP
jgi:hypothetical protein